MMRSALALGTALAVCCIGFEAASSEAEEPSLATLIESVKRLSERVEEMEDSRAEDQRRIRELEEKLETVRYADRSDQASVVEVEAIRSTQGVRDLSGDAIDQPPEPVFGHTALP